MDEERLKKGEAMRRRVLGDAYVDGRAATEFTRDLEALITGFAWGEMWTRPGLDPKIRSIVTLVIAATRSQWDEYRVHVRGALNNGLTREELKEVLLHTAVYGGFPAARTGFKEAQTVIAEIEAEKTGAKS
ncbi:MAG TPA: carboxymuconolactone decarboxylase family protein [Beijerinckiaceae bacterium]|jgi:4-carboxymuconolactone decarboxylase